MSQARTAALNVELRLLQPGLDIQAQFRVAPGHVCALMGRPGAGKTALLQSMVGLLQAQGGRINLGSDVLYDPGSRINLPPERRHLVLHEGHLVFTRDDEREFLSPEVAEVAAMIGEPDQVIDRIRQLEAAGLTHFAFQVTDRPVEQMRYFAETVMNRYT